MARKPTVAILYDFDKTLCSDDMQNFSFIPAIGMTPEEFWGATGKFSNKTGVERILSYMFMMVQKAKEAGIPCTKEWLNSLGKDVKFYDGVLTWFKRINKFGKSLGLNVEHYLISSGTKEIIEGTTIAKEFKEIYGCEFLFDKETKLPIWPKLAVNYTQKTQYLFRISKGVTKATEDDKLNNKSEKAKRIPFRNIIYLGDGMTDVPCMLLVKENGGKSIAVHTKAGYDKVKNLVKQERVNYVIKADYRENSELDRIIKLILRSISIAEQLEDKERKDRSK